MRRPTWTYGTTLSTAEVASSLLLRSVAYPDSAGSSDLLSYSYNRQGERTTLTDQRGCAHTYLDDGLGRAIHDCVTTLGSGVDDSSVVDNIRSEGIAINVVELR